MLLYKFPNGDKRLAVIPGFRNSDGDAHQCWGHFREQQGGRDYVFRRESQERLKRPVVVRWM